VTETLGLDGDSFIGEMVDGILGDHYPVPDRVLVNTEKIVQAYLDNTMCENDPPAGTMDIFVTEGEPPPCPIYLIPSKRTSS